MLDSPAADVSICDPPRPPTAEAGRGTKRLKSGELGRGAADRRGVFPELVIDFRKLHDAGNRGLQLVDDGYRCFPRRQHAETAGIFVIRNALFRDGEHIGKQRAAPDVGDAGANGCRTRRCA